MPLLYFWRGDNYRRDLDYGVGYHLNQASRTLHDGIETGESLWAFTRSPNGRYVLAANLVAAGKTLNPPGFRYGRYRLWGDLARSRYFVTAHQPDLTPLVRSLSIRSGNGLLGQAFQGHAAVRRISEGDGDRLEAYARHLPTEPRARLLPEERLEALLLAGDEDAVIRLLRDEDPGLAEERKRYLISGARRRDRMLVGELRELYHGQCQICGWSPRSTYGAEICETHHVRWLSRGGRDAMDNLVLVCPNHHRAIHRCDAPFDYQLSGFVFGRDLERIRDNRHELIA